MEKIKTNQLNPTGHGLMAEEWLNANPEADIVHFETEKGAFTWNKTTNEGIVWNKRDQSFFGKFYPETNRFQTKKNLEGSSKPTFHFPAKRDEKKVVSSLHNARGAGRKPTGNAREHTIHIRLNDEELEVYRRIGSEAIREFLKSQVLKDQN